MISFCKLKIIILIVYTAIVVLLTALIVNGKSETNYFDKYSDKPYNDHINITVKIKENRESSYKTKTEYETATFYIGGYVQKGAAYKKAKYSNITFSLIGANKDGKISFDETTTTLSLSESNTTGQTSSSSISASSMFKRKITIENEKPIDNNNLAVVLGIKIKYTIEYNEEATNEDGSINYVYKSSSTKEVKTINSEITYKFNLTQIEDVESSFNQYEVRNLKGTVVENTKDPIDLTIDPNFNKESTTTGSVKNDKITFTPSLNNPNLAGEEIDCFSLEIFGKVLNDEKDKDNLFPDYIRVYSAFGRELSTSQAGRLAAVEMDEKYDISELYVLGYVKTVSGKEYTFNYKVNLK